MLQKTYKIRKFQNGSNKAGDPFVNYSVTVPGPIAEQLVDYQFTVELTEEGILFRPAEVQTEPVKLPSWASNGKSKPGRKPGRPKAEKPAEDAPVEKPAPARRGRPPKAKPVEAVAEDAVEKPKPRRGRPPKVKPVAETPAATEQDEAPKASTRKRPAATKTASKTKATTGRSRPGAKAAA